MRHRNAGKKLGRTASHRQALLKNLIKAFVLHGGITTTQSKARVLRPVIEKMVTYAATMANNKNVRFKKLFSELGDKDIVYRLCSIAETFDTSKGGYTRIVKFALPRKGDSAPMARIEWVK